MSWYWGRMSWHYIYLVAFDLECHGASCRLHGIEQHKSNLPCSAVILNKEHLGTLHNFVSFILNLISKLVMDFLIFHGLKLDEYVPHLNKSPCWLIFRELVMNQTKLTLKASPWTEINFVPQALLSHGSSRPTTNAVENYQKLNDVWISQLA